MQERFADENRPGGRNGRAAPGSGRGPVFVVGASRSGTTLVYSLLLASDAFPRYEAETLLLEEGPRRYGALHRERAYRSFIRDWLRSRQFSRSGLDPGAFAGRARDHRSSYLAFLEFFMGEVASRQGKTRWAEKTPGHVFSVRELAAHFPDARFLHVVRDGRDVALSRRRLGWTGTRSRNPLAALVYAAAHWEAAVAAGHSGARRLGERVLEIRYEDLVREPEPALRAIEQFAGVEIDRERLARAEVGSLGRANTAFGGTLSGISKGALERWRRELTPQELVAIEALVADLLELYRYPLVTGPEERLRMKWRLWRVWVSGTLRIRRLLTRHTPLGRLGRTGFEVGLT